MNNSRKDECVNGAEHGTTARVATSTKVPAYHAWGWKLVILLSSLWAGLAVGLLSSGY